MWTINKEEKLIFLYVFCAVILSAAGNIYNVVKPFSSRFRREINGCKLPKHPEYGSWSVFNNDTTEFRPGMIVSVGNTLFIKCSNNYHLIGSKTVVCVSDGWTEPIGRCLKTCKPRINTAFVSVNCTLNEALLKDCKTPVEGTIARFKCADFYEDLSLAIFPIHICINGKWSHDEPNCEPICGQKTVGNPTLIVNGDNVTRGDYPWQVAIYKNKKTLICGGSLINQRVILTAAHCLTDETGQIFPEKLFQVAVGKYYRQIDSVEDNEAQFSEVHQIYTSENYKGEIQNYVGDIAVIISKKIFTLSFTVQPVCVDWALRYEHTLKEISDPPMIGYVSGWGFTVEYKQPSEILKHLKVPLVTKRECEKYIPEDFERYLTNDKICAGYLNSSASVCRGDSGGGLVFRYNMKYYIMGIVSNSPQAQTAEGGCNSQQHGLYTKVNDYIASFLLEIEAQYRPTAADIECEKDPEKCLRPTIEASMTKPFLNPPISISKNLCVLPPQIKFGQWKIQRGDLSSSPSTFVASGTALEITCSENTQLVGGKIIVCKNGKWSGNVGSCLKICPSLISTNITFVECSFKNKEISCNRALDGAIARYNCANYYEDPQFSKNPIRLCRDGKWEQKPPECVPVCGLKSVSTTPLIVGGNVAKPGEYPWQVSIYSIYGKELAKELSCGGSLLNERVILTAASCVTKLDGSIQPLDIFLVAVGKHYEQYEDPRDLFAQYSEVENIFVPEKFEGLFSNHYGDIAIIVTSKMFTFSQRVQPVCVDWTSQHENSFANVTANLTGYISGWGLTSPYGNVSTNVISTELKSLKIPYVPFKTCLQDLPEDFRILLTPDKMCGGYLNQNQSACLGDSGSGLVFKHNGRYYVAGIASIFVPFSDDDDDNGYGCDSNHYSLYTKLSHFLPFILKYEANYRPTRQAVEVCDSDECLDIDETVLSESCVLPQHPEFGRWIIFDSNVSESDIIPGTTVSLDTIIEIKCRNNFILEGEMFLSCEKNGWTSKIGKCVKSCPSLLNTSTTQVTCTYQGKISENCENPLNGSMATFECTSYYELPQNSYSPALVCLNGEWSRKPIKCVPSTGPICGQKRVSTTPFIINGNNVSREAYPWHVGLYNHTDMKYICGGTLISDRVILTGAVCVTYGTGKAMSPDSFKIAVGKFYVKFDDAQDILYSQTSEIERIFTPDEYFGDEGNYLGDIAVLITKTRLKFSPSVQPACVDWGLKYEKRTMNFFRTNRFYGLVPGWGFTNESGIASKELQEIKIPGRTYMNCLDNLVDRRFYLTFDKFCAGYENGTSICHGDTGGGLVFKHEGRYYVTGIVSLPINTTDNKCDIHLYGLYTKVSTYIDFIRNSAEQFIL